MRLPLSELVRIRALDETDTYGFLGMCYAGYSELEYRFHILRTGTQREALEVYRQRWRSIANE